MPIQLAIQYKNGATENKNLDKETITIGRHRRNDIVLQTDEVSREHARINFRENMSYFSCQGKFGASLNGRVLAAGEEPQLQIGDRIEICGNTLTVQDGRAPVLSFVEPTPPTVAATGFGLKMSSRDADLMMPAPSADAVLPQKTQLTGRRALRNRYSTDLMNDALILAKELDTLYRNHVTEDSLVRRQKLKETLKNRLRELNESGRNEMIELLKERFCTRDEVWKRLIRQDKELMAQKGKEEATKATLEIVAQKLMEKARPFQSEAELSLFGENLQQTMLLFLELFRDLEAKRQKNYQPAAAPNQPNSTEAFPLQPATSLKEIGEFLLDWSSEDGNKKARRWLETNLRKLRSHEQALKAADEEGLMNVTNQLFQRLNPAAFESQIRSEKLRFKIFQKLLGPLLDWRCWLRFKKEFQKLQNQQRSTFQKWFSDEFDRVYQRKMGELLAGFDSGEKPKKVMRNANDQLKYQRT